MTLGKGKKVHNKSTNLKKRRKSLEEWTVKEVKALLLCKRFRKRPIKFYSHQINRYKNPKKYKAKRDLQTIQYLNLH